MAKGNGEDPGDDDDNRGTGSGDQPTQTPEQKSRVHRLEVSDREDDSFSALAVRRPDNPYQMRKPRNEKTDGESPSDRRLESTDDRKRVALYLHTLKDVVTAEQWLKLCKATLDLALAGDWRAREWISFYLVGRPIERVQVDSEETIHIVAELPAIREQRPRIVSPKE